MPRRNRSLRRQVRNLRRQLEVKELAAKMATPTQRGIVAAPQSQLRRPIYASQVPVTDPYMSPMAYGAYQKGQAYFSGYGQGVSFELLRLAARRCLLIQAMHSCCLHEFLQLAPYAPTRQDIGWRVEPRQLQRQQASREIGAQVPDLPPEIEHRRAIIQARFECPHPLYEPTFSGFMAKILKDHLTINRVVIELIRDQRGRVVQFRAIDGATILPTYCVLERFIEARSWGSGAPMAYETAAKMLEQETGHPIRDAEYVCVMRGQLVGTFAPGELLVWEFDPSTDTREIFPPSYVEKALEGIVAWLYAFQYNKVYFQLGNPIEVILGISGAIEDDSFVALQEQLRENFSGLKGAWRVPLVQLPVEGMMSVIKLKENHRDMQFMEWIDVLISLVCAIYRKHPNRIYFSAKAQEGAAIFEHSKEHEIESSEEEGFANNRIFFGQNLNMLAQLLDPAMSFVWSGLDLDDRAAQIGIETQEVTHYVSIDELRERKGEQPFSKPWSSIPLNPLIFQAEGLGGQSSAGGGEPGGGDGFGTDADGSPSRADKVKELMARRNGANDPEDADEGSGPSRALTVGVLGARMKRQQQAAKAAQWEEIEV